MWLELAWCFKRVALPQPCNRILKSWLRPFPTNTVPSFSCWNSASEGAFNCFNETQMNGSLQMKDSSAARFLNCNTA